MSKNMTIWAVDDQTRLRFKLLCVAKSLSGAKLLKEMVDDEYSSDKVIPNKSQTRKIRRVIKKFTG